MFIAKLDEAFYPGVESGWDDKLFREFILERIDPATIVLDLGAGAGIIPEMNFKGRAARVCGVDPDERVLKNPYLDEAKIGVGENIPYGAESFDLIFADNVVEHLSAPTDVFREAARVLKPGGRFLFKTPNRRHYMPTIARFTPHIFHQFYNRLRGREHEDTFETHYRANTPADAARHGAAAGFDLSEVRLIESRPEYLRLSAVTYLGGIVYERAVNRIPGLGGFRILMICEMTKR